MIFFRLAINLIFLFFIYSMIKIQNKIHHGCNVLEYYLDNKFLFKTKNYDDAFAKMNLVDKHLYYDRTEVSFKLKKIIFFSY